MSRKKKKEINDDRDLIRSLPCAACGKFPPSEPAHIKSRGAGAKYFHAEMIPLCRVHHQLQTDEGFSSLVRSYPYVETELNLRGWYFENIFGVTKLRSRL